MLKFDLNDMGVHRVSRPPIIIDGVIIEADYPEGSINPKADIKGGFGFYLSGPPSFADQLVHATEVQFSYSLMFQHDWDWAKGGKLPGVFGGVGPLSYGCTGGRQESRCQCFDLRPMWRAGGTGELYTYIPPTPQNTSQQLSVPPRSIQNNDFGFSVGRGSFRFEPGVWTTVAIRVKLNDVGVDNGEVEMRVGGVRVVDLTGLCLRVEEESRIKGMHFQTFFGGHTPDWASPKDQKAWFRDIEGVILN